MLRSWLLQPLSTLVISATIRVDEESRSQHSVWIASSILNEDSDIPILMADGRWLVTGATLETSRLWFIMNQSPCCAGYDCANIGLVPDLLCIAPLVRFTSGLWITVHQTIGTMHSMHGVRIYRGRSLFYQPHLTFLKLPLASML
jgi:hypothetical protein